MEEWSPPPVNKTNENQVAGSAMVSLTVNQFTLLTSNRPVVALKAALRHALGETLE